MTYATAIMHPYTAHGNLSATVDRYGTHDDLCSTDMDTYGAFNNLSTAKDPYKVTVSAPIPILARPMNIPCDPAVIVRTTAKPARTSTSLPAG